MGRFSAHNNALSREEYPLGRKWTAASPSMSSLVHGGYQREGDHFESARAQDDSLLEEWHSFGRLDQNAAGHCICAFHRGVECDSWGWKILKFRSLAVRCPMQHSRSIMPGWDVTSFAKNTNHKSLAFLLGQEDGLHALNVQILQTLCDDIPLGSFFLQKSNKNINR